MTGPDQQKDSRKLQQGVAWLNAINEHTLGRVVSAVVIFGLTMVAYGWLNRNLSPRFDLLTPLDVLIPLWPWTISIYFSHYAMLIWAAAQAKASEYVRLLFAVLTVNFTCYIGFIALTAHYPRPAPEAIESTFWRAWFAWAFTQDGPGNTFPSLHVAVTWYLVLWRWDRADRWLWALWGVAILISTLTVKQHFVWDVLGGMAVAHGVFLLWARGQRKPITSGK
jgi:hypothetical protein